MRGSFFVCLEQCSPFLCHCHWGAAIQTVTEGPVLRVHTHSRPLTGHAEKCTAKSYRIGYIKNGGEATAHFARNYVSPLLCADATLPMRASPGIGANGLGPAGVDYGSSLLGLRRFTGVYGDRIRIAEFRGPQPTPDFLDRSSPASRRRTPSRRPHGSMNFRSFAAVNGLRPPEAARA
jgi:hypothetical protein